MFLRTRRFIFLRPPTPDMRFAIFGDIHANLEALKAVLADAEKHEATNYVCLGDVVGYNANPHECLEIVRNLDCPVVKGNHDEYASSLCSLETFNPLAMAQKNPIAPRSSQVMATRANAAVIPTSQRISGRQRSASCEAQKRAKGMGMR